MASAQKRGFRLPWGGDVPRDDSDVDGSTAATVAEPGERVADPTELELPSADDATEGSFDVPDEILESRLASIGGRATNDAEPEAEAEADEDAPAPERRPVNANRPGITAGWPDTDRRREEAARTEHATSDARPPQASPPDDAPPARGTGAPGAAPAPAAAPATPPRRDNPLVTGLLKAMREAAATARDETIAGFRADVTARVEVVRTEGGTAVAGLRTNADADIVGIREWG